ncbi:MAG: phospholipase D-like domain-containing protein [Rhodanobacter sp.]
MTHCMRLFIVVAAYSFTCRPIASALRTAKARGAGVHIVADRSQRTARYRSVRYLANEGIPVRIDDRYAMMHNKFMVIDDAAVHATWHTLWSRVAATVERTGAAPEPTLRGARLARWVRQFACCVPHAPASNG